jgi:hypothetical protein
MKRLFLVLLALSVVAGCRKKTTPPEDGGGGGGGGGGAGPTPESTAVYFGIKTDSAFVYWDSVYSRRGFPAGDTSIVDTVLTIFYPYISSGGELRVPYTDTFLIANRVLKDTLYVRGDTLYQYYTLVFDTTVPSPDTIRLRYIIGIKPLTVGKTWTPISHKQSLNDTLKVPLMPTCTLVIRLDSFKVDSSRARVIDTLTITVPGGSFSVFRIAYNRHARAFYGLSTRPSGCVPVSGDTNTTFDSWDTLYIKPYFGAVRSVGKDSIQVNFKIFSYPEVLRRYRAYVRKAPRP